MEVRKIHDVSVMISLQDCIKKQIHGLERGLQLRALAILVTLPKDLHSVPGTHKAVHHCLVTPDSGDVTSLHRHTCRQNSNVHFLRKKKEKNQTQSLSAIERAVPARRPGYAKVLPSSYENALCLLVFCHVPQVRIILIKMGILIRKTLP